LYNDVNQNNILDNLMEGGFKSKLCEFKLKKCVMLHGRLINLKIFKILIIQIKVKFLYLYLFSLITTSKCINCTLSDCIES